MIEKSATFWLTRPQVLAAFKYLRSKTPIKALPPASNTSAPIPISDGVGCWYRGEMTASYGKTSYKFQASNRKEAYDRSRQWASRLAKHAKSLDPTRITPFTLYLDTHNVPVDHVSDVTTAWWFNNDVPSVTGKIV